MYGWKRTVWAFQKSSAKSQGKGKENKSKKNKKGLEQLYGKPKEKKPPPKPRAENHDQNDEEKVAVNDETDMVDSLTGLPHEAGDILMQNGMIMVEI